MRQLRKSSAAAIIGLGALALLAAPSLAASDQSPAKAGVQVQLAHMGQGQGGNPGMMGQGQSPGATPGYGMGACQGYGSGSGMMGSGMMTPGMGGQGMMAPQGMMRPGMGPQGMMGSGMDNQDMMGPGFGKGPSLGNQVVPSRDLTTDDVRHFLEHRLEMHGNKRVQVGEVKEADDDKIVADITTVDGSLIQRLEVDRHTGMMKHVE